MHMIFLLCMSTYLATEPSESYVNTNEDVTYNYGVILDGGSSGTKVKIFRWSRLQYVSADDNSKTPLIDMKMVRLVKFPPGISTKAFSPEEIPAYLDPVIDDVKQNVPPAKHSTTPIYFMATAGMLSLFSFKMLE